jgi:hypothetical protein
MMNALCYFYIILFNRRFKKLRRAIYLFRDDYYYYFYIYYWNYLIQKITINI